MTVSTASQLPDIIVWLQALLVPTIAVAGAWIAWHQMLTARVKLQNDLFDRRGVVFKATSTYWHLCMRNAHNDRDKEEFLKGVSDAPFLFDQPVIKLLENINEHADYMIDANKVFGYDNISEGKRDHFRELMDSNRKWFKDNYKSLQLSFRTYLYIPAVNPLGSGTKKFFVATRHSLIHSYSQVRDRFDRQLRHINLNITTNKRKSWRE